MKSVARRIVDRHVLHLIKQWLEAPVEEDDGHGHRKRTTSNRDTGRGTPQGAPISPLLSNLYMRRFILGWKTLGYARRWSAQIVNYADDFVICCKGRAEDAMDAMRGMMEQLKLTVNDDKTHLCQYRKSGLTSWVTPSGGATTARPGAPTSALGPRRRASNGWWKASLRKPTAAEPYWMPSLSWDG
jgi:RNA-directed DNA polymerase